MMWKKWKTSVMPVGQRIFRGEKTLDNAPQYQQPSINNSSEKGKSLLISQKNFGKVTNIHITSQKGKIFSTCSQ